jgi:hypothetical protein
MRSDDQRGDFEYSRKAIMATEWRIKAVHLGNCNCAYGCPCKFTALPTHGNCRSVVAYEIEEGYFGAIRLDGLRAALITSWRSQASGALSRAQSNVDAVSRTNTC